MKSKKSKASEIKKCLKKGIPVKELESSSLVPPQTGFMLDGVPAEPLTGVPAFPVEAPPEKLEKNNDLPEHLVKICSTAGLIVPSFQKVIKFTKRDFNSDCAGLSASGEKKAKNLILNILSGENCDYGFAVSPKAADRKKKNRLILDYVHMFLKAYEFLTEKTTLSAEDAKERLHPYFIKTMMRMFLDEEIE